jgi:phage-related protein
VGADVFVELRATISEFQAKMAEARGEMTKTQSHGEGAFKQLESVGKLALLGVSAAAVSVGVASIHMADEFEASHARLVTAITNTGKSFDQFATPISVAEKSMENLGFTHAQVEATLASLTTSLGDPTKALDLLGTTANLAAYKQVPLADAAIAVAKGFEGQLRPLKQMGIDLPVVAASAEKIKVAQENLIKTQTALNDLLVKHPDAVNANSKAHAAYETALTRVAAAQGKLNDLQSSGGQIIDALNQKVGGQAAAAAETFSGKMNVLRAKAEDLGVAIGLKLIPVITQLAGYLLDGVNWLEKHRTAMIELAVAIGGPLLAAMGLYIASLFTAGGALTFLLSPVILVAAAVGALAAGVIYAYNHWTAFRNVVDGVWQWLSGTLWPGMLSFANWLLAIWPTVRAAAALEWNAIYNAIAIPVGAVVTFVQQEIGFLETWWHAHMQSISDVASVTWKAIGMAVSLYVTYITDVIKTGLDLIAAIWKPAWGFISTVLDAQWRVIKAIVDVAIHSVMDTIGIVLDVLTGHWRQAWTDLKDLAMRPMRDLVGLVSGLNADFLKAGRALAQGVIDGVKSLVPDLLRTVGDMASGVINQVKHLFGIASPSSVFYEIGTNMIGGLSGGISDALTKLVTTGPGGIITKLQSAVSAAVSGAGFGQGDLGNIGGPTPSGPVPAGGNAALGQQMAAARGWTGLQWGALNAVATRESGWSNTARNASSGAYGIAQALPPTKYPFAGQAAGGSNPGAQIGWMLDYIAGRYGTPTAAWAHEVQAGWYDQGGWLPQGLSLALNTTGAPERVVGPGGPSGGVTIVVNVAGNVQTERDLMSAIRTGLQRFGRSLPSLGLP